MSGKGSAPRPFSVSNQEYAERWDAIFHRDRKEEEDAKAEDEAFELIKRQAALNKLARIEDELGLSIEDTYNPLVK